MTNNRIKKPRKLEVKVNSESSFSTRSKPVNILPNRKKLNSVIQSWMESNKIPSLSEWAEAFNVSEDNITVRIVERTETTIVFVGVNN